MKHGVSVIFLYRRIRIVTLSALICLGVQAIGGQNRAVAAEMTYGMSRVLAAGLHPQPINWSGNYFQMKDGALDKWDFSADGTFAHEGAAAGGGYSRTTSERGVYTISGNTITLQFCCSASGIISGPVVGASQGAAVSGPVRLYFGVIGPNGEQGIVLGSDQLKKRPW